MTPSSGYRPVPRPVQRAGGAFILACGALVAWMAWRQAATGAEFSMKGSFLGPAFAVLGLGLILWPGYREERLARGESLDALEGMRLLTPRWWGILAGGLAAGALYTLALRYGWLAP
ncbi:MAG: hypothetical protein JO040_09380 [Gemmatimonadetes bacterium]|nr:hypothetical protein [Gemmatimonadota bacterium]